MATVPQRRPFVRPVKTCERVELHAQGSGPLFLLIGAGRQSKSYGLSPLPSDFGRAFAVESRVEGKTYHVCIDGPRTSCSCPGFLWTGGCKHAWAILQLIEGGRL